MINNMLFISLILTAAVYGLREGRKKGEGEERERGKEREREGDKKFAYGP